MDPRDGRAAFTAFEKNGWNALGDAYHAHWGDLVSQVVEPLLDAAQVGEGTAHLDVACGPGDLVAAATRRGAVSRGLDFAQVQLEIARRRHPGLTFEIGDAQALPFEEASFNAITIANGINHLPAPEEHFSEALRVLRPGGHYALAVWAPPRPGEGFGIVLGAIERHGAPVELPAAPPYFRFADPEAARDALSTAGFTDVRSFEQPQFWDHHSPDQVFAAFDEGAVRATAMLRRQPEDRCKVLRRVIREEVEKLGEDGRYMVPVPSAVTVACKT